MGTALERTPILQAERLTKRFRHGSEVVEAIKDVTLRLEAGDFVAVMGASGSGKSTLLHVTAGLTEPDEGRVVIGGTDFLALKDHARTVFRRKHIGLVFQAFNLIPSLTAEENMALPLLLGEGSNGGGRIDGLIGSLGLSHVRTRRPDAMSVGEQQRVAIGRALATGPSLVLADEPTGSLDSLNGIKLCENLAKLCREDNVAVLMVTHNPLVAFFAERVVVLHDGLLVHECRTSEFASAQDFTCDCIERIQKIEEVAG